MEKDYRMVATDDTKQKQATKGEKEEEEENTQCK